MVIAIILGVIGTYYSSVNMLRVSINDISHLSGNNSAIHYLFCIGFFQINIYLKLYYTIVVVIIFNKPAAVFSVPLRQPLSPNTKNESFALDTATFIKFGALLIK